jgi:hypothetical protein
MQIMRGELDGAERLIARGAREANEARGA